MNARAVGAVEGVEDVRLPVAQQGEAGVELGEYRTACTMLLHAGLNVRAVASRMGHENPNVTLAVYAHALKSADQQAADLLESVLTKKTVQKFSIHSIVPR